MAWHKSTLEDGCVAFEYIKSDWRFCIFLEEDPKESSWCYVSKKPRIVGTRLGIVLHHILKYLLV